MRLSYGGILFSLPSSISAGSSFLKNDESIPMVRFVFFPVFPYFSRPFHFLREIMILLVFFVFYSLLYLTPIRLLPAKDCHRARGGTRSAVRLACVFGVPGGCVRLASA